MSIRAGSILHVGGQNVIDRIQQAGLGNVNLPVETIREVGNREVVDKIPTEPDFTFTIQSFNVSVELMAFLTGSSGSQASGAGPGAADPEGTEYNWLDCVMVNIASPWKDPATGSAGVVEAGHLIPGYYPTKYSLNFGVTDNAQQTAELSGGSYFYAKAAPREEQFSAVGSKEFITTDPTVHYRKGGSEGSEFKDVFGVLVNGVLQTEGIDFTVTGGGGSAAHIHFTTAPESGADVRAAYFTSAAKSYPQTVHASSQVVPGAVRGRNVKVEVDGNRLGGVQTYTLEASVEGEVEREMGTEDVIGYVVNGTDCNGTATIRAKDKAAFFDTMHKVTNVEENEVFGWFNDHTVLLDAKIENPKNPGEILKTVRVTDAKFQPPGTPAQVNQATDFQFQWSSVTGTFSEWKGEP